MTNITKAAQQALDALFVAYDQTCSVGRPKDWKQIKDAIDALSKALQDKAGEVDERVAFEARVVKESGEGAIAKWLGTESYENSRVQDNRLGWVWCLDHLAGQPAAQATPEQNAEAAGLLSATGHLSTLLNESTQMLAQLRALVDALHNQWSNGGAPERGEYPLLDRVDDWLGARPSEMVSPKQATPEPEQWRKRRMANVPHPHDQESRIIGFVVPKDDAPIGMVTEQLAAIIGANATPEPLNEQDAALLNQAHEILLEHAEDQRHKGNDSQAMGATCSADAVLRLSAQAFARQRATPTPQQAAGEPVAVFDEFKGRPTLLPSAPLLKHGDKLYTHPAPGVPEGWTVSAYKAAGLTIQSVGQLKGPDLWKIADAAGNVLNIHGEWEWESAPSSRDDAFFARCRYASLAEASVALTAARAKGADHG